MPPTYPLSTLTNEFGEHVVDAESGLPVFHAYSSHALIQAAGYLKYNLALTYNKGVYFRGQTRLYSNITPSLFRGLTKTTKLTQWRRKINNFIDQIYSEGKALNAVRKDCSEALLQHYGIRTTWLDVVDNIWIALWFACHKAISFGYPSEYLHFERRDPDFYRSEEPEYAYILLIASANKPSNSLPGRFVDNISETIDLRVAAPSHFVRPHAQHGILVRKLSKNGLPVSDCSALHVGTIRVDLPTALDWIGSSATLNAHALFPPAFYDSGYRELLNYVRPNVPELGAIHRVQP